PRDGATMPWESIPARPLGSRALREPIINENSPTTMSPSPIISRRSFLKTSATAGAFVALVGLPEARLLAEALDSGLPDWVDRPMRWAQLTLVEDDPGQFDPQFWLDYFKRTRSDAACLSAGGCVALYP